jgi:hypothetical protein
MKTVNINLNVASITPNTQPENVIPCPRVNIFKHPIMPEHITQVGNYNSTFILEDGERCGVDFFAWKNNTLNIITDLPVETKAAGENLDQIQKTINITEEGTYNITVNIF